MLDQIKQDLCCFIVSTEVVSDSLSQLVEGDNIHCRVKLQHIVFRSVEHFLNVTHKRRVLEEIEVFILHSGVHGLVVHKAALFLQE